MQLYCNSLTEYKRLATREVKVGDLVLGNNHPIRLQTMTTTDTMDTIGTVEQTIRCIEAGAELVRITAPSKNEAENLRNIKEELRRRGYTTPLIADIHFTPNAAEIAARIIEKVRVNPGNYVDKKKFEFIDYTDLEYNEEIDRIRERFTPLVKICREYGTAMRIGTNHGSLSDRIMSRYGDTPMGMVESAMEFLRIARAESYHSIVLSMKSSNPQVMVQAYRLLIQQMMQEFNECYPLHLGVTEAGDGEDGRVKSAAGIGTLLEDGIGDTIRVSLTEDPEFEIPVCRDLVKRYENKMTDDRSKITDSNTNLSYNNNQLSTVPPVIPPVEKIPYDPFVYKRRATFAVDNIGEKHVPVVIADFSKIDKITPAHLQSIGYTYNEATDKWAISDAAADYVFTGSQILSFALPGTLKVIVYPNAWLQVEDKTKYFPIFQDSGYVKADVKSNLNFVMIDCFNDTTSVNDFTHLDALANDPTVVLCLSSTHPHAMPAVRRMFMELELRNVLNPAVIICDSYWQTADEHLIHYATECGALLLDGFGDGVCLGMNSNAYNSASANNASGRNYLNNATIEQFINSTAFSILQATRTRISKTEYISCPSCGRTLFELQETTAKIRAVTNHLKGVKIAIMGCIVNGPGEMADADFGYVGSGVGKITLYRGKEVVKRNVNSDIAVSELIMLLKESDAWVEPAV
ncbi:(E)-4-hydroxy-3-methylbut-2-enyl-diphosphate synthase [Segetibacter aerophilus]|uniref:4-hydroxy-3-methylbut-2-en-1-yl diphosphate synthase (flavodoxin) n=1 Tax=Segetibacter aerophilus TaxID=670293 RepID=A0A512BFA6_9BACT|nr:(E)-4-hydroxy-3-methylbut-2-enyl-diphosphate synthase [Segetibacter aerophilus]GEO10646.1 4-hydroxy-3-methylbut-2-en-1-yl diphosphate synthase (flavodoxin) [Segetibacter aerophilus]